MIPCLQIMRRLDPLFVCFHGAFVCEKEPLEGHHDAHEAPVMGLWPLSRHKMSVAGPFDVLSLSFGRFLLDCMSFELCKPQKNRKKLSRVPVRLLVLCSLFLLLLSVWMESGACAWPMGVPLALSDALHRRRAAPQSVGEGTAKRVSLLREREAFHWCSCTVTSQMQIML